MSSFIQKLGNFYIQAEDTAPLPYHYALYRWWINREYTRLMRMLTKQEVQVEYVTGQPYKSMLELKHDFVNNRRIRISTDHNEPVLCTPEDNLKFRLVHDWYHIALNAPFSLEGEFKIYRQHCIDLGGRNKLLKNILRCEILLQVCAYYTAGYNVKQKVVGI